MNSEHTEFLLDHRNVSSLQHSPLKITFECAGKRMKINCVSTIMYLEGICDCFDDLFHTNTHNIRHHNFTIAAMCFTNFYRNGAKNDCNREEQDEGECVVDIICKISMN
jgi:hypothetical protein